MRSGQFSGLKRFILWDYPRAGWQYDVMVAIILAFIFLTPREFFRDQPRASNVVSLPAPEGMSAYWVETNLLAGLPDSERGAQAMRLVKSRYRRAGNLVRIEPMLDPEDETRGWIVYTRP